MTSRDDDRPPTLREVADLLARLRDLTMPGSNVDRQERDAFLADKQALLDRIERDLNGSPPAGREPEQARRDQLTQWHAEDQTDGDAAGADDSPTDVRGW